MANLCVSLRRRRDVRAEEIAHLVEDDGNGHGGNEASDDGDGDEFEKKAQLQETKYHAVDAHHQRHSRRNL